MTNPTADERPPFRLADEERDWESGEDAASWPPLEFKADDTRWWKEMGGLGHDGTVRWEAATDV